MFAHCGHEVRERERKMESERWKRKSVGRDKRRRKKGRDV